MIKIPKHKLRLLPAIHVKGHNYDDTYDEYLKAICNGAAGVFLISHDTAACNAAILKHHFDCILFHPHAGVPVGVNALDVPARDMYAAFPRAQAIWCDDIGCYGDYEEPPAVRASVPDNVELFGSVAFKYQPQPTDLKRAVEVAAQYTTSITTSGPATGDAPDLEKIRKICEYAGPEGRVAIASGVTCDNVLDYVALGVSDFIVSTGISESFHHLDEDKVYNMSLLLRAADTRNDTIGIAVPDLNPGDPDRLHRAGLNVRRASSVKITGQLSNAEHRRLISDCVKRYDAANI